MPSVATIEKSDIQCTLCCNHNRYFTSRNQLFDHLREDHGFQRDIFVSPKDRTAAAMAARIAYFNPHHDAYYRRQCQAGLMTLEEWEEACHYFKLPLRVAFRISPVNGARGVALKRLEKLAGDSLISSPLIASCRTAGRPLREWSPDAQQALVDGQELGVVNRQELCSMVPPLLLLSNNMHKLQPKKKNLTVLDLCAAPGSKTLQLMDMLNHHHDPTLHGTCPNGFHGMLVANDPNRQRLLTVARRARIAGGTWFAKKTSLLLNSSDGRYFPALRKWAGYKLKFDYVLADVPCSGDGTLRKGSSKAWQQWNVKQHLPLHKLQLRLLQRCLELVKKGGRVVYSTCSLDPIENEAVVAAAITFMGGPTVYRIVKPPEYLHEGSAKPFPYTQGTDRWIVPHPEFDSTIQPSAFEEFLDVPEELRRKDIQRTMFPPSNEELKQSLRNCCRNFPQHLNSGGFFCAIIERVPPKFFAISVPSLRDHTSNNLADSGSVHHGRIYHFPEENDNVNTGDESHISPVKRLRTILRVDRARRIMEGADPDTLEFCFEGLPTVETAQNWLRQHGALVEGRSQTVSDFPIIDISETVVSRPKQWYNQPDDEIKSTCPVYTPLVVAPRPELVAEFINFFGMHTLLDSAKEAGVQRFPVEELVAVGGGERAYEVTTNVMGSETSSAETLKKPKFLLLTLVSKEIRTLFAGGAQFHPMELGLALCWVPLGPVTDSLSTYDKKEKSTTTNLALKRSRYGLMDDAAEMIGRCATKRILRLSIEPARTLLKTRSLGDVVKTFPELASESSGSIIAIYNSTTLETEIFLSCALQEKTGSLDLLTERRTSGAWLRLLESKILE